MAYALAWTGHRASLASLCILPRARAGVVPAARARGGVVPAVRARAIAVQCAAGLPGTAIAAPAATKVAAVLLGYCCLLGSCFRSVPQIAKVWGNRSVEGLSTTTNLVELLCYTIVVAYNVKRGYAFNTFGEVLACWVQDVVLVALILAFQGVSPIVSGTCAVAFSGLCFWLLGDSCSQQLLSTLQAATIVIMPLFARLPQVVLNWRRGDSGMLSGTTCLLNVLGNTVRIFTTLVLTGDPLMLASSLTQGALNSVLLCQTTATALARRRQRQHAIATSRDSPLVTGVAT